MVKRSSGVSIPQKESLTALKIQQRQHREREEHQQAQNDMTPMQRREIAAIQSNLASNLPKEDTEDGWEMDVSEVMSGQAVFDMSHAGGEFTEIIDLAEDMLQTSKRYMSIFQLKFQYILLICILAIVHETTAHDAIVQSAGPRHLRPKCLP